MSGLDMVSLFEGQAETLFETITTSSGLQLCVQYIDEYPGASQSGYHLWPGARSLCAYLCTHWATLCTEFRVGTSAPTTTTGSTPTIPTTTTTTAKPLRVAELGSGMGLAGICVAALGAQNNSVEFVLATDADAIILERVLESAHRTATVLETPLTPLKTKTMRWGEDLESLVADGYAHTFDLVVGSDLIYSDGLIEPLLRTAMQLLKKDDPNARFLLCYSFLGYTEEALQVSNALNLDMEVLCDDLKPGDQDGFCSGHRVECYRRKKSVHLLEV